MVDREDVLLHSLGVRGMEVAVMEIIRVIAMTDGLMTATRTVLVGVVVPMLHGSSSPRRMVSPRPPGQARPEAA